MSVTYDALTSNDWQCISWFQTLILFIYTCSMTFSVKNKKARSLYVHDRQKEENFLNTVESLLSSIYNLTYLVGHVSEGKDKLVLENFKRKNTLHK